MIKSILLFLYNSSFSIILFFGKNSFIFTILYFISEIFILNFFNDIIFIHKFYIYIEIKSDIFKYKISFLQFINLLPLNNNLILNHFNYIWSKILSFLNFCCLNNNSSHTHIKIFIFIILD